MVNYSKLSAFVLSLCTTTQLVASKNLGYHSLGFDIYKGTSFEDAKARVKRDSSQLVDSVFDLVKRADNTVEMTLENQNTFYSVVLKVGSQEEEVTVLVDTGSSDLWVTGSNNPFCSSSSSRSSSSSSSSTRKFRKLDDGDFYSDLQNELNSNDNKQASEGAVEAIAATQSITNKAVTSVRVTSSMATINCDTYGTFDSSRSSSFRSNNTDFYILYGDTTFALGTWGVDTLVIDGLSVENLSFAVASQTNSTVGVLGIGLEGLETTNAGALAKSGPYTYANLPTKLVEDGLIHRRVYSLYLNEASADSGNILFGGVDHAKYSGTLQTIPVINTLVNYGYSEPIKLEVTLSGVSYNGKSLSSTQYAALLDSGTTLTYAPSSLISSIASAVGASYSSTYGYYMMSCPTRSSDVKNITFSFQGVEINAPLTNFLLAATSTQCVLAIMDSGDNSLIMGDSFLRSAYIVYDLDNLEIAMAQVKYSDSTSIDAVSDSTIPSATRAASYSQTLGVTGSSSSRTNPIGLIGTGSAGITTSIGQTTGTVQTISRSRTSASASGSGTVNKNDGGRLSAGAGGFVGVCFFLVSLLSLI